MLLANCIFPLQSSTKMGSHPISPHLSIQDMEDEIECDDDYTMQAMASGAGDMQLLTRFQSEHDEDYQVCTKSCFVYFRRAADAIRNSII